MRQRQSLLGIPGYAYGRLKIEEQEAYRKICETIKKCERIPLSYSPLGSKSDFARILACIDMDHPELFWMDGYQNKWAMAKNALDLMQNPDVLNEALTAMKDGADYDGDGEISMFERHLSGGRAALEADPLMAWSVDSSLTLSPFWGVKRVQRTQERFSKYLEGCKELIADGTDDYLILRTVFEYVAKHTSYNFRRIRKSQDIRSVFVERQSVCKGYAEALQYLLLDFGIPCFTVQGIAESNSGIKGAHAWNYVLIDGVWNIVDVTAGDWDLDSRPERMPSIPSEVRAEFVDYRCMCLDGANYKPASFIDYPATGNTSDYFMREGYILQPNAWRSFVKICQRLHAGSEKYVQVRCVGDYRELDEWMRSALSIAVRICVVLDESPIDTASLDKALVERAKSLSREEVSNAGWGDFGLSIYPITAKRNVVLLASSC